MMAFKDDFPASQVKSRPSHSQKHEYNNRVDLLGTKQRSMKSEGSKRLNSLTSDTSLSEIDMEESGYFEPSSSIFGDGMHGTRTFGGGLPDTSASHNGFESKHQTKIHNGLGFDTSKPYHGGVTVEVPSELSNELPHELRRNGLLQTFGNELTVGKTNDILSMSLNSSICSDESLEGDLTNEHARLTTVMNNIDPKRLNNYLKRKLKQNDVTTILALSSLLPKRKFKGETLHCVRCHKEFDPKHGDKTCRLVHREQDVMKISEDLTGSDFGCENCGTVFRIEGKWKYKQNYNKKYDCGSCFVGKHTVSTDEVKFEPEGISKTCEDYGCIVFYV